MKKSLIFLSLFLFLICFTSFDSYAAEPSSSYSILGYTYVGSTRYVYIFDTSLINNPQDFTYDGHIFNTGRPCLYGGNSPLFVRNPVPSGYNAMMFDYGSNSRYDTGSGYPINSLENFVLNVPYFDNVVDASNYSQGLSYNPDSVIAGSIPISYKSGNADYIILVKNFIERYTINPITKSFDSYIRVVNYDNDLPPLRSHTVNFSFSLPTKDSLDSWLSANNLTGVFHENKIILLNNIRENNLNLRWNNDLVYAEAISYNFTFDDETLEFTIDLNSDSDFATFVKSKFGQDYDYNTAITLFLRPQFLRQYVTYGESPNFFVGGDSFYYPSHFNYHYDLIEQKDVSVHVPSDVQPDGSVNAPPANVLDNALLAALIAALTNQGQNESYFYNYYNHYESSSENILDSLWDGSNEDIDYAVSGLQNTLMSLRNIPLLFNTAFANFFPVYIMNTIYFVIMLALIVVIICIVRRFI